LAGETARIREACLQATGPIDSLLRSLYVSALYTHWTGMTKHHPTARRVHRVTHDEDTFVSSVLGGTAWAQTHSRHIVIGAVIAVILVVGFMYVRTTGSARRDLAAQELSRVRATMQTGNTQLAQQDLEGYIRRFGSTDAGTEAKIMLAQVYLQGKQPQKAIDALESLAGDVDTPAGFTAAMLLAASYEESKQFDQADRTYLRIADDARFDFQKREALDRAARVRADQGNLAGAIELYDRIVATYADPDDPQTAGERNAYAMRLAELRAAAATGTPTR
jgi:predicted negative regulator of RcsB-dependent stress response